jgi:hypothetical protein
MYFNKTRIGLGTLAILLCASFSLYAEQGERGGPQLMTEYNGITDPDSIPLDFRLRMFLTNYSGQLDSQLYSGDRAAILKGVRQLGKFEGLYLALSPIHTRNVVCTMLDEGAEEGVAAEELQEYEDAEFERKNKVAERFFSALSSEGQDLVMQYLETDVTPYINTFRATNLPAMVLSHPGSFQLRMAQICAALPEKFRGEYVQEAIRDGEHASVTRSWVR